MRKEVEIKLNPSEANDPVRWKYIAASILGIQQGKIFHIKPIKRSIDARSKVVFRLKMEVFIGEHLPEADKIKPMALPYVGDKRRIIVIGAGPAGLFAALTLIKKGLKPVILERGKDVKARKYDISMLNRGIQLNDDSNYCFGEGGAGTFSDGKLYTRSTKRGNVNDILKILVQHGANPEILYDAHPHIGTDKLPGIINAIRRTILESGGEIYFNRRVTDIIIKDKKVKGVIDHLNNEYQASSVILATGHSARDIFSLLHSKGILIQPKPFALGVRVEHPQQLIDSIQYRMSDRGPYLPASSYSLVTQVDGRGVFSFCMCPGGTIVPAATGQGETVVNGMSNSRRNSPFANSGIAVAIEAEDWKDYSSFGPFAALAFQRSIEQKAWVASGKSFKAPAQRLVDFVENRISESLPECSYNPGLVSTNLSEVLPYFLSSRLQKGFIEFNKKMNGFLTNEAIITGVESRTSSPVRIPRDENTLMHPDISGLYPCGEGAGYAGGIVSSAIDGVIVAEAIK